ncbi:MAG TPA: NAD-dependent epimerase/dehydratase family protein [Acidimicrobiales bacterium]|nr:NAD-dependent epimerase/dehydratase family protein [Acidimicrobiales bacterium]
MRVLVTGGFGFIGTALVDRLVAQGHSVAVADRRPPPEGDRPVTSVVADLRDPGAVDAALDTDPEAVIHLAAATSVLLSVEAPHEVYRSNVEVTADLLEGCRARGIATFLFASTNAVVGPMDGDRITEDAPLRPLTPYGATKAAAEMLMSAYRSSYGMAATSLRLTNVYGPGVWVKDGLVARLFRAARRQQAVKVYGDGLQVRDYVYIDDVVDAFVQGLARPLPPVVIVGSGRSVNVFDLHRVACDVSGEAIGLEEAPAQPGEMRAVVIDRALAASAGLPVPVQLEAGLAATWAAWPDDDAPVPPALPTRR